MFGAADDSSPDFKVIREVLVKYQKAQYIKGWDDFASAVPEEIRKKIKDLLTECRANGFIYPVADSEGIQFSQVLSQRTIPDYCVMCDRECKIRTGLETGYFKSLRQTIPGWREPKKCWEVAE